MMPLHDHELRCGTCQLHARLCICGLVPRLCTRTQVVLLVHHREARKPSNTGQLAARCLVRSAVHIVGQRHQLIAAPQPNHGLPLVLFPDSDAEPIENYASSPVAISLLVPDGNWSQASKMRRRGPGLESVRCVTLPDTGPSEYRLRAEPRRGGLATFEAIARALRILEGETGPEIERAMLAVFRVMVERTLWFRGKLAAEEVAGGVPPAALARDPRGERTRQVAARVVGPRQPEPAPLA
jgi:DTW domain-containing protein